ncbi:unnamed protein product, partial [Symbiodinium pilosum]
NPPEAPAAAEEADGRAHRPDASAKEASRKEAKAKIPEKRPEEPPPKEEPEEQSAQMGSTEEPVGWLPEGHECNTCKKQVSAFGGVFCGRRKAGFIPIAGCGAAVCWRCMNRSSKDASFGK